MSVISSYCSFFNYRIVEEIINNLGTEWDKTNLKKYKEAFSTYAQHHVFECPSELGEMSEIGHANMFVTLATYDSYTISHLYAFVSNLERVLKIPPMSLRLCRIGSGSLKLVFQLSHSVQQTTFPLSSDQEADLACLGVVELSCGDYQLTNIMEVGNPASDEDSDSTDSEQSAASMEVCDAESVSVRAAGLAMAKPGNTFSVADSAIGRSSYTGSTAGLTVFSEDILDRELGILSAGMGHDITAVKGDDSGAGWTEVHSASAKGELQEVRRLTEEEQLNPLQGERKYGLNALHLATRNGHLDVLRYFIEDQGCSAACVDLEGRTPLHHAAQLKHLNIVQYLVEKQQMDPANWTKHGMIALHYACAGGSVDVIHYLVKEMSKYLPFKDVVYHRAGLGILPVHWAAMNGRLEAIKFLITELNCDPNAAANGGVTSLHLATAKGHLDIVQYLIEQQQCDPDRIALREARERGHHHIIEYLEAINK